MEHMGTRYGLMSINIVASLATWHLQSTPSSLALLGFPANTAKSYSETLPEQCLWSNTSFCNTFCGQKAVRMQLKLMQQFNSVTESERKKQQTGRQQTETAGKLFPRLFGWHHYNTIFNVSYWATEKNPEFCQTSIIWPLQPHHDYTLFRRNTLKHICILI